ncbi:MAG: type IV pilus assembly protein PilM [Patescibacteria group bacterium]
MLYFFIGKEKTVFLKAMFFFKKKPKSYLGIDIGASAVKIVELGKEEGRYKLENYAIFSLADYLSQENRQISSEAQKLSNQEMVELVKETIKEAGFDSRSAYLAIPVYSSFFTSIDFPNMSKKEIAAAIPFEARKYVPVPISEVILDWSLINPNNQKDYQQVLLIAVLKKVFDDYNQITRSAGLDLKGIEGETFSLSRALVGNDKSVIILLDAGARSINISIVDQGYIRLAHNLEMGGQKISQTIAQQMGISLGKAEQIKKKLSVSREATQELVQAKEILQASLGAIIIEIKKIIDSYQNKYHQKIEKCVLAGGGANLIGFNDSLVNRLGLDVSLANPFARVIYPEKLKPILKDLGPSLAVATGLAMRED